MAPARPVRWAVPTVLLTAALAAAQPPAAQPPGPQPPGPQPPAAGPPTTTPATPPATAPAQPKAPTWPKEIGGKSLQDWIGEMSPAKNPDSSLRDAAIRTLPLFGPAARKPSLKPLCAVIETDPDPGVRVTALLVLGGMGFDTREEMRACANAIAALIGKTAKGSMVRLHAVRTLAGFGPEAASTSVIAAVIYAADDSAWETRQAVAAALGRLGAPIFDDKPPPPSNPPRVIQPKQKANKAAMDKLAFTLLKDPSMFVRLEACQSLLVLGPPNTPDPKAYVADVAPYLRALTERLRDEKENGVRIWLLVLEMMYDNQTFDRNVPKIAAFVESSEPALQIHALNALGVLGVRAQPALPEIRRALHHKDGTVVLSAIACLVAMGEAGKDAIGDLERLQKETKDEVLKKLAENAVAALKAGKRDLQVTNKDEMIKKP